LKRQCYINITFIKTKQKERFFQVISMKFYYNNECSYKFQDKFVENIWKLGGKMSE